MGGTLNPEWQKIDKTDLNIKIKRGDIQIFGTDTVEYEGIDVPLSFIYGPLPEGANYWVAEDLNGDGLLEVFAASTNESGEETIYNVYDINNEGEIETTSYEEWSAPDLSELIAEYGEDVVNDAKAKYDELVDFIGNVPDDPVGSIKKIIDIYMEGVAGVPSECSDGITGGPLDEWYKKCVTVGVLIEIGIPGLPGGLGGIFKGATIGEIEEALKKIGKKFEDIVNGTPTCGKDGKQECTPENILGDLAREVIDSIGSIFKDAEDKITVESVLGKLGSIFGSVLGGIIYDQFKDLINDEIENVIGIPVIPFAPLDECEKKDLETIETSPGQYECGECKQEGFTPTGPQGECIDPNAVEDYDCSQAGREQVEGAQTAADCGACVETTEDGTQFEPNPTTGFCEDPTVDDPALTEQEQLCKDTGRKYDDLNDVCLEECENPQYKIKADGDCGPDDGPEPTPCPNDGEVRRGGLDDGYCVKPGQSCQSEPTKYAGDDPNINVGQFNSEGFCVAPDDGPPDDTEGQCPDGREPDYFPEDADQDGSFEYDGYSYTYDPCDPAGKENSLYATPIQDTCGNNAVNAPDCNQCENGESPDAHVNSDCNEPLKEVGTNQGDACDLAEAGYSSGGVGVIDANGDCKKVGQACNRQLYGFGAEDNCPTGQGYNTPIGVINSNGDCECSAIEEPPEVDCSEITEDNYTDCNKVKCPEGSTTPYADSLDDCVAAPAPTCEENDPNSESDGQGGCQCKDNFYFSNETQKCEPTKQPPEQCRDDQGNPTGAIYPDCNKCPEGQDFNKSGICEDVPVVTCQDPNATNYEQAGECGPCKDLYDRPEGYDECTLIETLCQDPQYAEGNELCQGPCADGEVEFVAQNGEIFCDAPCAYNDQIASSSPDCVAPVEPCPTFNGVEGPRDDQGNCYDCTDEANAMVCGWAECPDGSMAPTLEDCVAPPNPCDDSVYAAENPQECGYTCDDPNATVLEGGLTPGACGPCKEGYVFDGAVERCVQESVDPCDDPEYAAANPTECGTTPSPDCSDPEYAAANPEECAPAPPPETGGSGGGGGGGMMGSFTPFLAGISYTPQAVPEPPAPAQKDYMAELDNIIKRSLFEGMA